jgi:hypothetical protein
MDKIKKSFPVIPKFTSLIRPPKLLVRQKLVKRKWISHYFLIGITIGLRKEGARISENWLVNWKKGINLCILYKQKLLNRLLVYRGITVHIRESDHICSPCFVSFQFSFSKLNFSNYVYYSQEEMGQVAVPGNISVE